MSTAPLRLGARVALVATAGPIVPELLDRAVALLREWGLEPSVRPSARAQHRWSDYLAGDDAGRAHDIQDAWCAPDVDAIFCIRGGYGTVRILDRLDAGAMAGARPKPVYGSSDVTALHEWLRERLGVSSWFTPMIATISLLDDAEATTALRGAVLGPREDLVLRGPDTELLLSGSMGATSREVGGTLIGGNLSLLAMTLAARGRPAFDHAGCVAILEDVGEDTYRIDGFLQSLLRAGWFDGVAAVALGGWHECGPLAEIRQLSLDTFGPLDVPVLWEVGFGHGAGAPSVPLGVRGTIRGGDDPALVVAARDLAEEDAS